jgi:hypothetical protein
MGLFTEQTNPHSILRLNENHCILRIITFQATSSKLGMVYVSFSFRTGLSKVMIYVSSICFKEFHQKREAAFPLD